MLLATPAIFAPAPLVATLVAPLRPQATELLSIFAYPVVYFGYENAHFHRVRSNLNNAK